MAVPYGKSFVAEGPLPGVESSCVLLARQRGTTGVPTAVVKLFPVDPAASTQSLDRRMTVILLQDRAVADGSPHVAPVLDLGVSGRDAWYVTRRYEQSLAGYLAALHGKPAPGRVIWQILLGVTRGALALSLTDPKERGVRRAHGNLKPGNVLVGHTTRTAATEVVVTDPAVGIGEPQEFERRDVAALGRMLVQLVQGRAIPDSGDWTGIQSELTRPAPAWRTAFKGGAEVWRQLTGRLLGDPSRRPGLAELEVKLIALEPPEPKGPVPLPWVLGVALLLLAGGLGVYLWRLPSPSLGVLEVTSDPPGALLTVGTNTVGVTPFTNTFPGGAIILEGRFTNGFIHLPPQRKSIELKAGERTAVRLDFPHTELSFESPPLSAEVSWRQPGGPTKLGYTPVTGVLLPPGTNEFTFVLTDYLTIERTNISSPGSKTTITVKLEKLPPNSVLVTFESGIYGAKLNLGTKVVERFGYGLLRKSSNYLAKVEFPPPWRVISTNFVTGTSNFTFNVTPPHGSLQLDGADELQEAELSVVARDGTNMFGKLKDSPFFWPEGEFRIGVKLAGYESSNTAPFRIVAGQTNLLPIELKPLFGFLDVTANLDGARLFTNGVEIPMDALGSALRRVSLPPFADSELVARYDTEQGSLEALTNVIKVRPGVTTVTNFVFSFATLELAPESSNTVVRLAGRDPPLTNLVRYLRPGGNYTFVAEEDHFLPLTNTIALAAGKQERWPIRLAPRLYPLMAEISPAEAALTVAGSSAPWPVGLTHVPWGSYTLELSHPKLGKTTLTFATDESGGVVTNRWRLPHARVNVTKLQAGLLGRLDGEDLPGVAPFTNLLIRPGPHAWEFAYRDFAGPNKTNYQSDLPDNDELNTLPFDAQFLLPMYMNTLGMRLVLITNTLYVAEFETTRGQFDRMIPPIENSGQDPNDPAVTTDTSKPPVSFNKALEFCRGLSADAGETRRLGGLPGGPWIYGLPRQVEWLLYADERRKDHGIFSGVGVQPAIDRGRENRVGPEPGLQDVWGNAAELVEAHDGTATYNGGSFGSGSAPSDPTPLGPEEGDGDVGFRLVLRHQQP